MLTEMSLQFSLHLKNSGRDTETGKSFGMPGTSPDSKYLYIF